MWNWVIPLTGQFHMLILERGSEVFFYECPIPFYECVFTRLKLKLPFNGFNERMMGNMKISPSQLHPVVWALVKVY